MNRRDYEKLHERYHSTTVVIEQIKALERMIDGIKRRLKDEESLQSPKSERMLRMYVTSDRIRGRSYDRGVDIKLPEKILREAILPALEKQLELSRAEFKAI